MNVIEMNIMQIFNAFYAFSLDVSYSSLQERYVWKYEDHRSGKELHIPNNFGNVFVYIIAY